MFNNIPEILRRNSIEQLFATNTMIKSWPIWQTRILELLGNEFSENEIINLGDHLSSIFKLTGNSGRDQGELSGGGTAWESLVCWYLNLCFIGSRAVAIRKMSSVPTCIQDGITVNYGNFACNTESDITIIIFPDTPYYNDDINAIINILYSGERLSESKNGKLNPHFVNFITARDFNLLEIGIVQCKTNWNDNAQIPMLWDMIYSAGGFSGRNITIGRNGYSIQQSARFTYAFVTVPSNLRSSFTSNNVCTKRVANLSGGNFWGQATSPNVARSIKEIFTNNYSSASRETFRTDIRKNLPFLQKGDSLSYFRLNG